MGYVEFIIARWLTVGWPSTEKFLRMAIIVDQRTYNHNTVHPFRCILILNRAARYIAGRSQHQARFWVMVFTCGAMQGELNWHFGVIFDVDISSVSGNKRDDRQIP